MNNQQAFNIMVQHLIKQGKPAYDPKTMSCFYRGPEGTMCAVGPLIPDDVYRPDMENVAVYQLREFSFYGLDRDFLNVCQTKLHDQHCESQNFVEDMKLSASEIARNWGLNLKEALGDEADPDPRPVPLPV